MIGRGALKDFKTSAKRATGQVHFIRNEKFVSVAKSKSVGSSIQSYKVFRRRLFAICNNFLCELTSSGIFVNLGPNILTQ